MEGVSAEAASLAGHLGLGRLVFLYDDNHITIDGDTALVVRHRGRRGALRGLRLAHAARSRTRNDLDALDAAIARGDAPRRSARR